MVPPPEAYDWSNAETVPLTAPELSTLFTSDATDAGPRILGTAPATALRETFCNVIALDINNIDDIAKDHIAQLIDSCPKLSTKQQQPTHTNRLPLLNSILTNGDSKTTGKPTILPIISAASTNADAVVTTPHSSGLSFPPNTVILTAPIKPAESEAHTAIQVPSSCVTSSSATTDLLTNKMIDSDVVATPSNATASIPLVTANLGLLQPVGPIADTPSTYSPNSELVSFRRVQSNSVSLKPATSFCPPVQQQDKSPVTAPSVTPSALTRFSPHSVPPYVPANFRWTFNPQNETVTIHHLRKPAHVPLKPPSRFPLSDATADDPPVLLWLSKRHRDALKIKMYHLYANILSMDWLYDTLAALNHHSSPSAAMFPALPPDFNSENLVYPTTPMIRLDVLFAIISIFKLQSILRSVPLQIYDDYA
eukprot:jgi/Psemu1/45541/gm1.45541_g